MTVPPEYLAGLTAKNEAATKANCLHLLRAFADDPARHLATVRFLITEAREAFLPVATEFLLTAPRSAATNLLVNVLMVQGDLTSMLIDPGASSTGQAIALARIAGAADRSLAMRLAQVLARLDSRTPQGRCQARRILSLLDGLPPNTRALPVLMRLLRSEDAAIRSKAIKLVGAGKRDLQVLEAYSRDPDPRVRANALESLWGTDTPALRAFLHYARLDPSPRAAVNALIGLYILRDDDARSFLEQMAQSADPQFQSSAAWAMGRCRDPMFIPSLRKLVESPHPVVRRSALRSLVALNAGQVQSG